MNAERAAGRARYPKGVNWFKKKMDRDLKAASSQAMTLEYKIIYTIEGDIPVNPAWVGEKLEDAVDKLQIELHEKNLHGAHKLEFCYPEGWARP